MMVLFEVYTQGIPQSQPVLSPEAREETQAVEMTVEEAEKLGFGGLSDEVKAAQPRLIAVRSQDAGFIRHCVEHHAGVSQFRMHEVQGAG